MKRRKLELEYGEIDIDGRKSDDAFWNFIENRQESPCDFRAVGNAYFLTYDVDGVGKTESKIEQILAQCMRIPAEKWGYEIIPQFELGKFRYDFAIKNRAAGKIIALIECDGWEFHASEAARIRDAAKTKLAHDSGYLMFRFKGKDICNNPQKIADQVIFQVYPR